MKPSKAIKYKALFLLVTFSLNTVVGFACSLGIDMGFNSPHHKHDGDGHSRHTHSHHGNNHAEGHHHSKHFHAEKSGQSSSGSGNTMAFKTSNDDNCCNNLVVSFQNLDKQVVQKSNLVTPKNSLTSLIVLFIPTINNNVVFVKKVRIPPKIPLDHSLPDIRIFIQSFLI